MTAKGTTFSRNMRKAARALVAAARAHDAEFGELHARAVTPGGMALDLETRIRKIRLELERIFSTEVTEADTASVLGQLRQLEGDKS